MKLPYGAIERRLRAIEKARKAQNYAPMMPEFFYVWPEIEDVESFEREAEAKCKAMKPARYPSFVRFIGPEGGPELGTGPFTEDHMDGCDDDALEVYR